MFLSSSHMLLPWFLTHSLKPNHHLGFWCRRIPFRTIVVSLLSHQVLLQNLSDILLEEFVKQPEGPERVTPVTSDPSRPAAGFLRYISMTNLAIILDLLLDSYRFDDGCVHFFFQYRSEDVDPLLIFSCAGRRGTSIPGQV